MPTSEQTLMEAAEQAVLRVPQFRLFREMIYRTTGISLGENKLDFVQARLRKRLRHHQLSSFSAYYDLLKDNDPNGVEMQQMINRITTNKTHFYREEHHFEYLRETVFEKMISEANRGARRRKLRIWCAAASTGEEPYTLAMTTRDAFAGQPGWDVRILASDIDTNVLEKAQAGIYPIEQLAEIPSESLLQHFVETPTDHESLTVCAETKQLVTFRQLNLLEPEWPIRTQFDVIFCRNVLIYFDQGTQDKLMRHMSQYLAPDGSLFIGHSESLSGLADSLTRVGRTIYQHAAAAGRGAPSAKATQTKSRPANPVVRHHPPASPASHPTVQSPASPPAQVAVNVKRQAIIVGDVVASREPTVISTVLGSCIAVCLFDDEIGVGGMNHFALPTGEMTSRKIASFGIHAMELLINEIMHLGGDRRRLKSKVFGGANVLGFTDDDNIGQRNAQFIREFLVTESIPIASEYVGGDQGMQVLFETHTGKARMKLLDRHKAVEADKQLTRVQSSAPAEPAGDITLF